MLSSPNYLSSFVSNGSAAQYQKFSIPKDPRYDFWTVPIDSSAMNLAWPKSLDDQGSSSKRRLSDQDVELMIVDFKKFLVKHISKQSNSEGNKQFKLPQNFFNQNDLEEGTKSEEIKAALMNVVKLQM